MGVVRGILKVGNLGNILWDKEKEELICVVSGDGMEIYDGKEVEIEYEHSKKSRLIGNVKEIIVKNIKENEHG